MKVFLFWGSLLQLLFCILFPAGLMSQTYWLPVNEANIIVPSGASTIRAGNFKLYSLNLNPVRDIFSKAPLENLGTDDWTKAISIDIPMPDGQILPFELMQRHTMAPELMQKFPLISNGIIRCKSDHNIQGVVDVTYQGFHAMILSERFGTFFVDPYIHLNDAYYIVYRKSDFLTDKVFSCNAMHVPGEKETPKGEHLKGRVADNKLRTLRICIAATVEYTATQGGTVAGALSQINTTNNRISGLLTKELAVILQLIPNNNLVVYTSATGDPYTNSDNSAMLAQNHTNLVATIGSANYEMGHVFGTTGGGVAYVGVVCNNMYKDQGASGSPVPSSDAFDIDLVAHEFGHQLDMEHAFNNSCSGNRNYSTAIEPGSGSTIMSYSGSCIPSVQGTSDAYYNGVSLAQAGGFLVGTGPSCGTQVVMSNNAPTVTIPGGARTVPISTPFELTASASDPDGNAIYYCWEQTNNDTLFPAPPAPNYTSGPNFRTRPPQLSVPTRSFPQLSDVLSGNNQNTWEVLPSVGRTMNFRVTTRDNLVTGGRTHEANTTVTFHPTPGPFLLTSQNTSGITYAGGSSQTVSWSVNGTNALPISCSQVDILLSIDNGVTFPIVLAENTANDGTEVVVIPNVATSFARIKVRAEGNVFYDINNANVTITLSLPVELILFEGRRLDTGNLLHWESVNEVNLAEYVLERSSDAVYFEALQKFKAKGMTKAGYNFTDHFTEQKDWYYRLKMIDYDGKTDLSKIVFIGSNQNGGIRIFPNPATADLFIQWPDREGEDSFSIFNIFGQKMIEANQLNSVNPQPIPIGFLVPGVYWIQFHNTSQSPILFQKK